MERPLPIARKEAWTLGFVLCGALFLRVAFILGQRADVLFDFPVVDEERYVAMGRAFADGRVPDPRPWFHPPGLVYALGLIFHVAGPGLLAPRLLQALVSTGSCALAYVVARRFFDRRVAVGAAVICAVHGVLIFETYELLPPTWMLAADLVALWLLLRAKDAPGPMPALGAGIALGVAAVFGPTILPFVPFAAGWLRRPVAMAALVAGVLVPLAPVTWGNWQRGHELVVISTNGGINFFLGNGDDYDARLAIRPGPHWDELRERPRRAGIIGESAASSYHFAEGVAFWHQEPMRALALYARKLYLYFDGPEIPRDTDIQTLRHDSWLLRLLVTRGPPWLPDGLLVPLALVGALASFRDRRPFLLLGFLVTQALVVAAFFVTSRYRVPAVPVLAMLASEGVHRCIHAWRTVAGARRLLPVASCIALAVPLNVLTRESAGHYDAELDFYRGLALRNYRKDPAGAVPFFLQAVREDPDDARYAFELGTTQSILGHTDQAVAAWTVAAEDDPWDGRAARRAASVLGSSGHVERAVALLDALVAAHRRDDAYYALDHLNLALLHARAGEKNLAVAELTASRRADPDWFRMNVGGFTRQALSGPDAPRDSDFWGALSEADTEAGEVAAAADARRRANVASPGP